MTDNSSDSDLDGRALESQMLSLPGATVAALAVDERGRVRYEQAPDTAVAPASNTKLVTAALALEHLGPDHRFETTVVPQGAIDDGTLDGDLVLQGSGDPVFDAEDAAALAADLAERLDRVTGNLVLDTSLFAGPRFGPGRTWGDPRHAYGAPTASLSMARNCVTVSVETTGDEVAVSVEPDTAEVKTTVDVTVDDEATEDDLTVETDPDDGTVTVTGRIPPAIERTADAPVRSPARHCGLVVRGALADAGVTVAGRLVESSESIQRADDPPLAAVESPPLSTLVREMNVPSDNVIADTLARAVASDVAGEGSWTAWRELVTDHLAELGSETVRVRDGSGLSRYNRLTPRALVELLSWATEQAWADAFFDSLPAPGTGTLETRLDGVPVRAKTGTLTGTRALSGRLQRPASDVLFSVVFDDLTLRADEARDRQDEWVRSLQR